MKTEKKNSEDYGVSESRLIHYDCFRTSEPITIDGNLDKPAWRKANQSPFFVDLVDGSPALLETRIACLWDDDALYAGFWISEPNITAGLTERDSYIWFDNDIEIFLDGDDCYYEFELNAFNTVYEVFFIYQDALKKGSRFDIPDFDLYEKDVDVLSGFQDAVRDGKHHRGKRWAFRDWDLSGLKSAVRLDGSINDPSVRDRGWTAEIALPWEGMKQLFDGRRIPPADGDAMRAAFFRFQKTDVNGKTLGHSAGWALNEHGSYDSHIPECFSYLHFHNREA